MSGALLVMEASVGGALMVWVIEVEVRKRAVGLYEAAAAAADDACDRHQRAGRRVRPKCI